MFLRCETCVLSNCLLLNKNMLKVTKIRGQHICFLFLCKLVILRKENIMIKLYTSNNIFMMMMHQHAECRIKQKYNVYINNT